MFKRINYSDLISNMKQYEIDIFNYVKKMIEAECSGKSELAFMYSCEATGYLSCLLFNDFIDHNTFDLLSDYVNHSCFE